MCKLFLLLSIALYVNHGEGQSCPRTLWADEFDGSSLDSAIWTPQIGDGCDIDLCGWGNFESQYYRAENAVVTGGKLVITAKEENFGTRQYTSARIRTLNKVAIDLDRSNVRISARIKVAESQGLWSAFWCMPTPEVLWPTGGEIDIMEVIGREPNLQQGFIHYGDLYNDKGILGGPLALPEPVADDFHEFSIEKSPNKISWLIDGYEFQSYTRQDIQPKFSWPFESTFHILMNLAVGGLWPGYPDETSLFPATMEVDYVRVTDVSSASIGKISGPNLLHEGEIGIYCILDSDAPNSSISWSVPSGATFMESEDCVEVTFGTTSGYVTAEVTSDCEAKSFRAPVNLQGFYGKEFSFATGSAPFGQSTGEQSSVVVDGAEAVQYERSMDEEFDNIIVSTGGIPDAAIYVNEEKRFFIDIKCETCAPCTRVMVQLEDSSQAFDTNWPVGRHSRYEALLEDMDGFQRLEFSFKDKPDTTVNDLAVDQLVLLFDGGSFRSDTYYVRNFDSSELGCISNCEALSSKTCRVAVRSEAGQCTDGVNNDGKGFDGNGVTDCDDPSCFNLDPACMVDERIETPAPVGPPTPSSTTTTPPPPSPTSTTTAATTTTTTTTTSFSSGTNPRCDAHSKCAGLSGDCCPTPTGDILACCNNFGVNEAPECSAHSKCEGLAGDCCPNAAGVKLACCDNFEDETIVTPVINNLPECSSHSQCEGLAGDCCPTPDGVKLACCDNFGINEAPECSAHSACDHLSGSCCPTPDGVILGCCDNFGLEFATTSSSSLLEARSSDLGSNAVARRSAANNWIGIGLLGFVFILGR